MVIMRQFYLNEAYILYKWQEEVELKFQTHILDIEIGKFRVILNKSDADEMGIRPGDRVRVINTDSVTALIEISDHMYERGVVGVYRDVKDKLNLKGGEEVEITPALRPRSTSGIKKKMNKEKLTQEEIHFIIKDIVDGNLSDTELSAFVTSSYIHGMDMNEIEWMTRAMVKTGEKIEFDTHPIMDKHSIGGVPGNKISLIVVPIVAASGLMIPKTSSRAITGAGGTADLMEVLAPVEFSAIEIKKLTEKIGGVIVWGGATNIAPADDRIIEAEYPLSIDPHAQLLASVMAKKSAVGADSVVIDLPTGTGTKIPSVLQARKIARDFMELGERLGIRVECAVTYGASPVGRTIGPALEVREALGVLETMQGPMSLIEKSTNIAGILLEMGGMAPKGSGKDVAVSILNSGKALKKLKQIIEAQGGNPKITSEDIVVGDKTADILALATGYVIEFENKRIVEIARTAGAPKDKGAGVKIHKKKGQYVEKGEPLITIYAEKEWKLSNAIKCAQREYPVVVEGMILERLEDVKEF